MRCGLSVVMGDVFTGRCDAQEIGQQLEAAALAMRMAMEADANAGMEESASSGNGAQQSTSKAAEKESKQVLTAAWDTCNLPF